jgi:hypothetical protein
MVDPLHIAIAVFLVLLVALVIFRVVRFILPVVIVAVAIFLILEFLLYLHNSGAVNF